ncbi:hypothetical protein [Ruminiclostridium cellobioparum]|uniref:hypothetical protein n=1 Tax=Ruminiclostridium cellobioparum TaxID=29355 RepID=UPI0028A592B0|nr:hypothetical protein [Ruminiclostridium cellobioparum]
MALRPRYMPSDIKEDIKIAGILPIDALPWIIGSFLLGILYAFISSTGFLVKIFIAFVPPVLIFIVAAFDVYNKLIRWLDFNYSKSKIKTLNDMSNIDEYNTICRTKNKYDKMFLECSVDPWEVCPDTIKEQRANNFSEEVFSALKDKAQVNIYAVSAPESTEQLDERFERLGSYPEGLREIEDARIAYHYHISRKASSTKYLISVGMRGQDDLSDVASLFEENAVVIGGDIVEDTVNSHLTPDAKIHRGKN